MDGRTIELFSFLVLDKDRSLSNFFLLCRRTKDLDRNCSCPLSGGTYFLCLDLVDRFNEIAIFDGCVDLRDKFDISDKSERSDADRLSSISLFAGHFPFRY